MGATANEIRLRVWGDYACFTRPEMKVERVSYEVMTPSAARGVLEAILWKPAIRWEVFRIDVLRPIRWISVRRNEVGSVVPIRSVLSAMAGANHALALYAEEDRQQRAGLFLRDVEYAIYARFHLTASAGPGESTAKFADMFRRRVAKGQCMMQPYLGCREFAAGFAGVDAGDAPAPIADTRELGWMLHDLDYAAAGARPYFFQAALEAGVLRVPPPVDEGRPA